MVSLRRRKTLYRPWRSLISSHSFDVNNVKNSFGRYSVWFNFRILTANKWTFIPYWCTRKNLNSKCSVSCKLSILISQEYMTLLSKSRCRFSAALVRIGDTKTGSTLTTLQYHFEKACCNFLGAWILSRKSFAYNRKGICSKQLLWKCGLLTLIFGWLFQNCRYTFLNLDGLVSTGKDLNKVVNDVWSIVQGG